MKQNKLLLIASLLTINMAILVSCDDKTSDVISNSSLPSTPSISSSIMATPSISTSPSL